MEFKDGLVIGFKPKFRSFGDDWERYMFAIVDLEEEGKITRTPGVPRPAPALRSAACAV